MLSRKSNRYLYFIDTRSESYFPLQLSVSSASSVYFLVCRSSVLPVCLFRLLSRLSFFCTVCLPLPSYFSSVVLLYCLSASSVLFIICLSSVSVCLLICVFRLPSHLPFFCDVCLVLCLVRLLWVALI